MSGLHVTKIGGIGISSHRLRALHLNADGNSSESQDFQKN